MINAVVIGAGPAGLMAAEVMARGGLNVTVCEAKPSVARKFLMAGKSGLNLTKDQGFDTFMAHFDRDELRPMIAKFGPNDVMEFAQTLGQDIFVGSTKRVFPKAMKASPLLRAWLGRLEKLGVRICTKHRWIDDTRFETPNGLVEYDADVTVLALGGGSWARLGSNGAWTQTMANWGVQTTAFQPMNMGFLVNWSDHMTRWFGQPIKNIALTAGGRHRLGEFVVTGQGVEGGVIYTLSDVLRDGSELTLDFVPALSVAQVRSKLENSRKGDSLASTLHKKFKIGGAKRALFFELFDSGKMDVAETLKSVAFPLKAPMPLDQAISTGGGIPFDELDANLMLNKRPGVFCAGEMLDWSAPTGGYLLTACFATGAWAGQAAVDYSVSMTR